MGKKISKVNSFLFHWVSIKDFLQEIDQTHFIVISFIVIKTN